VKPILNHFVRKPPTCHGHSCASALFPPTIRGWTNELGFTPQLRGRGLAGLTGVVVLSEVGRRVVEILGLNVVVTGGASESPSK